MSEEGDLLREVERRIAALESHPDARVRDDVTALLQGIDAVHRTALTHLVAAIHAMAGEAFMNRLTADPAIRLLLMSYDLIAVDRRLLAEEALDAVRGHLHEHGVDVELTQVVGGAVYVRVHGLATGRVPEAAVRRDVEAALRTGLLGFQELVLGDGPERTPLVQIQGLRGAQRPVYRRACALDDLAPGGVKPVEVDGEPVLVIFVEGLVHAVVDRCGESPLPLRLGTVAGAEIRCPWHGCRYDVRTGRRVDGGRGALRVLPVSVENDEVRIAVGVQPAVGGAA